MLGPPRLEPAQRPLPGPRLRLISGEAGPVRPGRPALSCGCWVRGSRRCSTGERCRPGRLRLADGTRCRPPRLVELEQPTCGWHPRDRPARASAGRGRRFCAPRPADQAARWRSASAGPPLWFTASRGGAMRVAFDRATRGDRYQGDALRADGHQQAGGRAVGRAEAGPQVRSRAPGCQRGWEDSSRVSSLVADHGAGRPPRHPELAEEKPKPRDVPDVVEVHVARSSERPLNPLRSADAVDGFVAVQPALG